MKTKAAQRVKLAYDRPSNMRGMMKNLLTLLWLAGMALGFQNLHAQIRQPNPETLKQDERFLAALTTSLQQINDVPDDQFYNQFWILSKKAAAKTGPHVIRALMKRSESWQGEEVLLYVPLVILLERAPTLKLLHEYLHSKIEAHRICADNLISEMDMPDTLEAYRKFSRKK